MAETPHLDAQYEAELRALNDHLLRAGDLAVSQMRDGVAALLTRDTALGKRVAKGDQPLNEVEVETDRMCVALLARRAPVGRDLRLVLCALKSVVDIERIGDYAVNIAKRAKKINTEAGLEPIPEIVELANATLELTEKAIRALATRDVELARAVRREDKRLDQLNKATFKRMIEIGQQQPDKIESALAWTSVSRHLERVGDHAVNIAEMVVFLVDGVIVRHTKPTENPA